MVKNPHHLPGTVGRKIDRRSNTALDPRIGIQKLFHLIIFISDVLPAVSCEYDQLIRGVFLQFDDQLRQRFLAERIHFAVIPHQGIGLVNYDNIVLLKKRFCLWRGMAHIHAFQLCAVDTYKPVIGKQLFIHHHLSHDPCHGCLGGSRRAQHHMDIVVYASSYTHAPSYPIVFHDVYHIQYLLFDLIHTDQLIQKTALFILLRFFFPADNGPAETVQKIEILILDHPLIRRIPVLYRILNDIFDQLTLVLIRHNGDDIDQTLIGKSLCRHNVARRKISPEQQPVILFHLFFIRIQKKLICGKA